MDVVKKDQRRGGEAVWPRFGGWTVLTKCRLLVIV